MPLLLLHHFHLGFGCSSSLMLCRQLPFLFFACLLPGAVCLLETFCTAPSTHRVFISTLNIIGIDHGAGGGTTVVHCTHTGLLQSVSQSVRPSLSMSLPPKLLSLSLLLFDFVLSQTLPLPIARGESGTNCRRMLYCWWWWSW